MNSVMAFLGTSEQISINLTVRSHLPGCSHLEDSTFCALRIDDVAFCLYQTLAFLSTFYHSISSVCIYRRIPQISPGLIWFHKSFLVGLSARGTVGWLYVEVNERREERMKKQLIFFIKTLFTSNVLFLLQMYQQRRIQNPVAHRKQLTAKTVIKNADAEQR